MSGFLCTGVRAQRIDISNMLPRTTVQGDTVDAHDGRVIKFGQRYYWYGTSYGNTNGFTTANHYVVYSSPDMVSWEKEGRLLPDQPEGVYYRPHVIYNERTGKYVLWYNWYPQLWDGQFGVAVSNRPEGPFEIVNDDVEMYRSEVGLGDFGLFVDRDGTGYISYNTIQNHQVSVEKLSDDYLSSTMQNGGIIAEHMEAGSQFRRGDKYYLLTDYTCCFCNYGSGARVYVSDDPLTGYALTGNINRRPGRYAPLMTDGQERGTLYETLRLPEEGESEHAVLQLERPQEVDGIQLSVFTGNRPENCGNVSNPRVHPKIGIPNFVVEYWNYDRWTRVGLLDSLRESSALRQEVTYRFLPVRTDRLRLRPVVEDYPSPDLYLNEVALHRHGRPVDNLRAYVAGPQVNQPPIIPAQQTYVMELPTAGGEPVFLWMGDLWGSASDNIKGHDYQYWSAPLEFNDDGTIRPLVWVDDWGVR